MASVAVPNKPVQFESVYNFRSPRGGLPLLGKRSRDGVKTASPKIFNDDIYGHLHNLCSLFHKISYKLEDNCPVDVGDQALKVFVMLDASNQKQDKADTSTQKDTQSTLKAELQKLIKFINELLSSKELKDLDESVEMEKLKRSIELYLNNCLEISVISRKWAMNVFYLLELDYEKFNIKIMDSPFGDLAYLKRQIEKTWEDKFDEIESEVGCSAKSLEFLGFFKSASQKIVSNVPTAIQGCQSSLYWAARYLKYKLFNDPLLSYVPRYPYQETKKNELFKEEIEGCEVNMINASDEDSIKLVKSFLEKSSKDQSFELFYHGTSHADAVSILERGVQLSMGSTEQDFSSGDGFYLYDNLQKAKEWAGAGRDKTKCQAVIVYKLNLDECKEGLILNGHEDNWKKIVALCRDPNANKFERMDVLKKYKFIRGPACKNKPDFQCCGHSQLCIRDRDFLNSQCNTQSIFGVVFY